MSKESNCARKLLVDHILKLSHCKDDFSTAAHEWHIYRIEDLGSCYGTCPCGQERLRYYHHIRNTVNGASTWVGSECIDIFENLAPLADLLETFFHGIQGTYLEDDQYGRHIFKISKNFGFYKNRDIIRAEYGSIPIQERKNQAILITQHQKMYKYHAGDAYLLKCLVRESLPGARMKSLVVKIQSSTVIAK